MAQPQQKPKPKPKLFPVRARGSNRESRLATAMGVNVAKALAEVLDRMADDAYNTTVINNPVAFALTQGREASMAVASDAPLRAYRNENLVPVALVLRADGGDVSEVLASNSGFTSTEAQIRGPNQIVTILQPRQEAWVSVRAANYPLRIVITAIPLRGKATVFGG